MIMSKKMFSLIAGLLLLLSGCAYSTYGRYYGYPEYDDYYYGYPYGSFYYGHLGHEFRGHHEFREHHPGEFEHHGERFEHHGRGELGHGSGGFGHREGAKHSGGHEGSHHG